VSAPRISVVLPIRDAGSTLDAALHSLRAQTFADFELLVVDDGSRDDGPARARAHAAADPRVRVITNEGRGLVAALTTGIAASRAPLIARMDADDVAHAERFAAQVAFLDGDPTIAVVGTEVEVVTVDVDVDVDVDVNVNVNVNDLPSAPAPTPNEGLRRYVSWQNAQHTPADHAREIFVEAPLCHPSVVMHKEALLDVGGYRNVPWPEDYDLWLRFHAAGHAMAKVPRVLLSWRHQAGRATFSDARYAPQRFLDAKAGFLAAELVRRGRPVWIWGAGPTGKRLARALEVFGVRAERFVDIDPLKIGGVARGQEVVAAEALRAGEVTVVAAVGSLGARAVIREALQARGFVEGRDFLCAA